MANKMKEKKKDILSSKQAQMKKYYDINFQKPLYELFAGGSIPCLFSNIPLGQDDCTAHVSNDRNAKCFLPTP